MNVAQVEFLTKQIIKLAGHIEKQLADKADLVRGYNTEIKESKKRMACYVKAVTIDHIEALEDVMYETELAEFSKLK